MIVALAGRRIDAIGARQRRFPLENVELVSERLREMLKTKASGVVCSAACGADLIALSAAITLGLRRRVVLPFERERFRETSVIDRPGDWGPVYDRVLNDVEASGNLVVIPKTSDEQAYSAASRAILNEAISWAAKLKQPVAACLVWDGASRGVDDLTEEFGVEARKRGLAVFEQMTI
ncbi:MAG: hypothetical protein LAO56_08940 [Acidobacteriia bacterium]|jgi:hypothetical protein|nr:hypothetical protein [Terriglobia bacterium]